MLSNLPTRLVASLVHLIVLLIASGAAGPAYASFITASWNITKGDSFSPPYIDAGGIQNATSINLNRPFSEVLAYGPHNITATGNVKLIGQDRQFGVETSSKIVVDPGVVNNILPFQISSSADLQLVDSMRCIVDASHANITMTAYWQVHGTLSAEAVGKYSASTPPVQLDYVNSSAGSILQISGTGVGPSQYGHNWGTAQTSINSFVTVSQDINQAPALVVPITFHFENNVPQQFGIEVSAISGATVLASDLITLQGGSASATVKFGDTFTWGGITSVTDADTGHPIADWTLVSDSGTDWAHAAPEPSSIALAAFGFFGLMGWGWRRRKR